MFKILIISIITFIIVIIIFLLFISFSNIDINTNSKINEKFFVNEPISTGGINGNYNGNLFIKYTQNGTITFNNDTFCKVLIVGGGGGGGKNNHWEGGGGGGGGGVGIGIIKFLAGTKYTINIGSGGYGAFGGSDQGVDGVSIGNNGNNTSITGGNINEIAYGGGGGGWRRGKDGGSGGGGGGHAGYFDGGISSRGQGILTYYGNNGGYGNNAAGGGGGGGAGSAGQSYSRGNYEGCDGGSGILCDIDNNYYGGGGGGASGCEYSCPKNPRLSKGGGIGGKGGGGKGGHRNDPTSGTNNTGGGGGGSSFNNGGNGGSGIVLINYVFNNSFNKVPWGFYLADEWSSGTLSDISGNGNDAITTGNITKTKGSGNGAMGAITYISGNTQTKVNWPEGSIPSNFTILSLTRYTGGSRRRILSSERTFGNWLQGHWENRRGVAHYEYFVTPTISIGNSHDWLCCIGKNSGSAPNNILVDGIGRGIANGGGGNSKLCINDNFWGENSDWALNCVIIWNEQLTEQEMLLLNYYCMYYKNTNDLDSFKNLIPVSTSAIKSISSSQSIYKTPIERDTNEFRTNFYRFSPYTTEFNSGITNSNISSINRSSTNTQNILTFKEDRFKKDGFFKEGQGEFITIKFKNNFCLKKIIFVAKSNTNDILYAPSAWQIYAGTDNTSDGGIGTNIIFKNIETGSINSTNDYLKTTDLKSTNNYIILLTNNIIEANVYKIVFTKTFGGDKLDFDQLILESGTTQTTITSTSS
jgi:hypothetical protein